jgi:hypothetical protein
LRFAREERRDLFEFCLLLRDLIVQLGEFLGEVATQNVSRKLNGYETIGARVLGRRGAWY